MEDQLGVLGLVLNAIVLWTTRLERRPRDRSDTTPSPARHRRNSTYT
jgi:hypothetical protein